MATLAGRGRRDGRRGLLRIEDEVEALDLGAALARCGPGHEFARLDIDLADPREGERFRADQLATEPLVNRRRALDLDDALLGLPHGP